MSAGEPIESSSSEAGQYFTVNKISQDDTYWEIGRGRYAPLEESKGEGSGVLAIHSDDPRLYDGSYTAVEALTGCKLMADPSIPLGECQQRIYRHVWERLFDTLKAGMVTADKLDKPFNVPDLRGKFIRGRDLDAENNP